MVSPEAEFLLKSLSEVPEKADSVNIIANLPTSILSFFISHGLKPIYGDGCEVFGEIISHDGKSSVGEYFSNPPE